MHGALSLALTLALGPAAAPEPGAQLDAEACHERELDFFVGFGPADAPTVLEVYLDPTQPDQLRRWLEARRIAGERGDTLRLELVPTRGGVTSSDPDADAVRLWFMAVALLGRPEEALRVLERQDWLRVAAQLRSEEGRAALARAVGLEPEAIELHRAGAGGSCLQRDLDHLSTSMAVQTMGQHATVVGIVDRNGNEQIQHVDPELSELRTALDRSTNLNPLDEDALGFVPFAPLMPGQSARLDRTFPDAGVLVGGDALPHRLLIFIEDEEHGRLPSWLAPAMRFRTRNPGRLSVQVIAVGVGSRAIQLRRRLCAARTLGLEVEYLHHLSERPSVRRLHEEALYEVLQPVADSDACSDSEPLEPTKGDDEAGPRRTSDFGQPRGAWLDGRPVNPADLESLEWQLDSEAAPSLIDWLLAPEMAADSFTFEL